MANSREVLSKKKKPLSVKKLRALIAHYQKKFDIKIILNGDTSLGQSMMSQKRDIIGRYDAEFKQQSDVCSMTAFAFVAFYWSTEEENKQVILKHIPKIYLDMLRSYGLNKDKRLYLSDEIGDKITALFSEFSFFDLDKKIKSSITLPELLKLDSLLWDVLIDVRQFSVFITKESVMTHDYKKAYALRATHDQCLSKLQAVHEISSIRDFLRLNEYVGYIFTNNRAKRGGHVEAIIISKDKIIKPVHWHSVGSYASMKHEDIDSLYVSDWLAGQPQSTNVECGTLVLLYLKELLKDHAAQLKKYGLCFKAYSKCFYPEDAEQLNFYFIPTPQVLRYSQSQSYNSRLMHAVKNDIGTDDGKSAYEILNRSIEIALQKGDGDTASQNQLLLQQFPEFRNRWLHEYQKSENKRNEFNDKYSLNQYLLFKSDKMQKMVEKTGHQWAIKS